ncbi:hypothetical protein Q1695_014093 [Nippostrongylus brasiliensis]|nr:hypothetical protein Q1695_014093 [Nippostrongylus brasiliensis]
MGRISLENQPLLKPWWTGSVWSAQRTPPAERAERMSVRESQSLTYIELRQSKENIEIVPQEACVQHKGPETMLQERHAREAAQMLASTDARRSNDLRRHPIRADQKRVSIV